MAIKAGRYFDNTDSHDILLILISKYGIENNELFVNLFFHCTKHYYQALVFMYLCSWN